LIESWRDYVEQLVGPRRRIAIVTDMLHITLRSTSVQENLMRGGLTGRSATGRNTRTRTIEAIRQDVRINTGLWQLAMNLVSA